MFIFADMENAENLPQNLFLHREFTFKTGNFEVLKIKRRTKVVVGRFCDLFTS